LSLNIKTLLSFRFPEIVVGLTDGGCRRLATILFQSPFCPKSKNRKSTIFCRRLAKSPATAGWGQFDNVYGLVIPSYACLILSISIFFI